MGRLAPQAPTGVIVFDRALSDREVARLRAAYLAAPSRPVFPPNRIIKEGEPICTLCGSGWSSHDDGTRSHAYEGALPLTRRLANFFVRLFGGVR